MSPSQRPLATDDNTKQTNKNKPEWWGSPLAQEEKYQEERKPVTRNYNNKYNRQVLVNQ
jgi:hypothetical protein